MRIGRFVALVATVVGGLVGFGLAPSQALPIGPGAAPGIAGNAAVQPAQYYYDSGPRVVVRGPVYRTRPAYRPVYRSYPTYRPVYRQRRVVRGPVYVGRPVRPRVVCTTRVRLVPTAYGYVRRPVRVCRRVY
jgi:hypothetical protein